jgi:hypothetical protein
LKPVGLQANCVCLKPVGLQANCVCSDPKATVTLEPQTTQHNSLDRLQIRQ